MNALPLFSQDSFFKFVVKETPQAGMDILQACARTGDEYWRVLFNHGLAQAIAQDAKLSRLFVQAFCGEVGHIQSPAIVDAFLTQLTPSDRMRFLGVTAENAKNHAVGNIFEGATRESNGAIFVQVLKILLDHGLTKDQLELVAKCKVAAYEQACLLVNVSFLSLVIPLLGTPPKRILIKIMQSESGDRSISVLMRCGVSFDTFSEPKLLVYACRPVYSFISAKEGRKLESVPRPGR